ncbi:MAG: substrate-binding domain-containing protein [Verrucomicrobiota bacterium]
MLPLFYEYARNLREGILEWVDSNPGWRIIEIDPQEQPLTERLAGHLHGAIVMTEMSSPSGHGARLRGLPLVNCRCASMPSPEDERQNVVTFDRRTISRLAVDHFSDLGLETVGYVGLRLREGEARVPHVAAMRDMAQTAGMRWMELDLHPVDPSEQPEWLWEGRNLRELVAFLRDCPKPAGFLAQDDYVGAMLCEAAASLGFHVPDHIAVLGQGDRVVGRTGFPALSSVVIPGHKIGWTAAAMLKDLLDGNPVNQRHALVPCEKIVMRASTGGMSLDIGVERAKRHFERHALDGVTVQELAEVAGFSVKTLRVRFMENYGMEIARTVRDRRKEMALHLLESTDLDIAEIGRRCGFSSAPNFFNFVRRQTGGAGPAEYRRSAARARLNSKHA